MSSSFFYSDRILTGRTRYSMKGRLWWRKLALQIEEAYEVTEIEHHTFHEEKYTQRRWRFATPADLLNLEAQANG